MARRTDEKRASPPMRRRTWGAVKRNRRKLDVNWNKRWHGAKINGRGIIDDARPVSRDHCWRRWLRGAKLVGRQGCASAHRCGTQLFTHNPDAVMVMMMMK